MKLRPCGVLVLLLGAAVLLVTVIAGTAAGTAGAGGDGSAGTRSTAHTAAAPKSVDVYATYYGWYDNTPPGCATAYPPYCAGGTGTYAHPITFASYKKEFPVGTILYYATVEKYFVMGDECQECEADWVGKGPDGGPGLHHVDLWIGGKGGNEFDAINCEDALTEGMPNGAPLLTPFIENPPRDLPVSTARLFNSKSDRCFGGMRTSASYGRYSNGASGKCLDDASATTGTPATVAPCSNTKSEDLAFEGAFFVVNDLCLKLEGTTYGSKLDWATCTGGARQQWETGSNGQIAWIQYLRCVGVSGGNVVLAKCNGAPPVTWTFTPE
jgi:hypothetical protein